ncbi:MAG: heme ABC transporter ATP-binding protein [Roseovarius sp.]
MSVAARGIGLTLGDREILRAVDFDARPGEVTAIVGPNGSGKTTLLRALTGELAARGEVTLNGVPVAARNATALALQRAVLPQAARLAFPFKVIEVVRMGLRAGPHARRPQLAERALAAVGLGGYGGRFHQELSGGEQQRMHLARVLCQVWEPVLDGRPCWLFLDEPVASLDIGHQLAVMGLARDYARQGGGVVAVMHDLNLTAMFADRVALMKAGRMLAQGPAPEVFTDALLGAAYGCALRANVAPEGPVPFILPQAAGLAHSP